VKALFEKFKSDESKAYETNDEESRRFTVFKENLVFIDKLNANNPMALFGVTRYADRTEEERSRLRMTNTEATSWAAMKRKLASIDGELVEAGEEGPDAVAALSTKRQNTRSAEAARAAKATADSSGDVSWVQGTSFKSGPSTNFSMMQGEVSWITTENCAACAKYPHFSEYNMGNMPTNFDWRELGAVSSVKNQAYCGACWSFTTAEDIEGAHYLATGELNSLSVQQMIACSTENYGCGGGYPFVAMQYVEHMGGLAHWSDWPYKNLCMDDACGKGAYDGTPTCRRETVNRVIRSGNGSAISGWQMVAMGADYEELLRVALLKNGPIALAFNANGMDFYIHGVTGCTQGWCDSGSIDHHVPCDPAVLDHAVLVVGYGTQTGSAYYLDRSQDEVEVPYWVIKNSWGSDWGEDGYYRIVRGDNHCGIANFAVHSVVNKIPEV